MNFPLFNVNKKPFLFDWVSATVIFIQIEVKSIFFQMFTLFFNKIDNK